MRDAMDVRVQRLQAERDEARRVADKNAADWAARGEQVCELSAALEDVRADLGATIRMRTAERDRYRAALEHIAAWRPDGVPIPNVQARTAREALNPPPAAEGVKIPMPPDMPLNQWVRVESTVRDGVLVEQTVTPLDAADEADDPRVGDAEDDRRDPDPDDAPRGWEP